VARLHDVPIIGQGGVASVSDAIEFLVAGAAAVGLGTGLFYQPLICRKINEGIADYLNRHGFATVNDIVGSLELPTSPSPVC
jgi:dihydroorotate dehydrogenase (NAD+) catalytic subunit